MEKKLENFLINDGLYSRGMDISSEDLNELESFLEGTYKIDAYCCECGANRVFIANNHKHPRGKAITYADPGEPTLQEKYELLIGDNPDVKRTFFCAKDGSHKLIFCCLLSNNKIIKYGQYPSLADLSTTNTRKYSKILGDKYSDFNRGIGLFSHGIGAGSLIYLRRVFEHLIEEAHKKAVNELSEWDEDSYPNKMEDKIHKLKDYLPDYLVENRKIYGILSKGVPSISLCNFHRASW